MTRLLLAAGVAALAITAPASAEKGGNKGGERAAKAERGGGKSGARAERSRGKRAEIRVQRRGGEARAERRAKRPERGGERRLARLERRDERRAGRGERREERKLVRVERREDRRANRGQRGDDRKLARIERREDRRDVRRGRGEDRKVARIERRDDRRDVRRDRRDDRRFARMERRDDRRELRVERRDDDRRFARVERRDRRERNELLRRLARYEQRNEPRIVFLGGDRSFNPRFVRRASYDNLYYGCPPGLIRYDGACWPQGQLNQLMVGELIPVTYRDRLLPLGLRDLYRDDDDYYYRYGDGYLYRVERRSNLIAALLPLLGGGYSVGQLFPTTYMNSYVPDYYRAFYPDTQDDYYRYYNGYVYEIDAGSGYIEDIHPMYGYGYGVGNMLPAGYSYYNVPYQYRDLYYDTDDYYYRYAPGAIYQVDRQSNLITAIASLLAGDLGVGSRLPMGYDVYNVPLAYRSQYYDTPTSWYRYNDGYIYQVDPTTRLITAVIQAIV